jgi:hypothetical protein
MLCRLFAIFLVRKINLDRKKRASGMDFCKHLRLLAESLHNIPYQTLLKPIQKPLKVLINKETKNINGGLREKNKFIEYVKARRFVMAIEEKKLAVPICCRGFLLTKSSFGLCLLDQPP